MRTQLVHLTLQQTMHGLEQKLDSSKMYRVRIRVTVTCYKSATVIRTDTDFLDCLLILLSISVFYILVFLSLHFFSFWFRAAD